MHDEDMLPVGLVARRLQVSPQRVRQLVADGRLPATRGVYGYRLIPRRAVERLLAEREADRERRARR